MNNLSPSAQALLRAGAKAARPSAADRERLSEALRGRLGDAAVLGEVSVAASRSAAGAVWVKVCAVTVGVGLLVGGAVVAWRPAAPPPAVPQPAQPASLPEPGAALSPVVSEPGGSPESPVALGATSPQLAPVGPSVAVPRRPSDRLSQEVALLSRATSALRSGRANEALKLLNEHQSRFPKGALAEERRAARAQALCALGRLSEARADLTSLSRTAPQSPQAARALKACSSPAR